MSIIKEEHITLLKHFRDYGSISTYEAKKLYGIHGLVKYINEIRLLGWNITEDCQQREDDPDDIEFYKVYVIKEVNVTLGEKGK